MVMKNKLYRTNHTGMFFKMRKIVLVTSITATVAIVVAIPTYINTVRAMNYSVKDVNASQEVVEENTLNESILSYQEN